MRLDLRKAALAAGFVAAAAVAAFSAQGVGALLTDSSAVPANAFNTASCWAAVKSRQTGTTTNTANAVQTVVISSIDPAKSFLVFGVRSNSNRPVASFLRGRIASATTLEFGRETDEASPAPIVIRWYVVEYSCGVNVQRGSVTLNATTTDVPITPVASLSRAFVTFSTTPWATDNNTDQNDQLVGELTSTSNLQIRADAVPGTHILWWEVVEFTSAPDINVQRGTTSMTGTTLTRTVTIPAVDLAETFLIVSFRTTGAGADMGARMLRATFTNATTIAFDRSASGTPDDITEIAWQTIELTGARVERGTQNFASGTAQRTVGLSPSVDTSRTIAFASVNSATGLAMGSSPYVADDIPGVSSFTAALSATQLTLDRTNTAAAADVGWFVVQLR